MHIKVDHIMTEPNYPAHEQLLMVPRKEAIIIIIIHPMGAVSDSDVQFKASLMNFGMPIELIMH